jgi:hypothetical protein
MARNTGRPHVIALATAIGAAAFLSTASAHAAQPNVWTPHVYSLGEATLVPVVITSRLDTGNGEEDVVVTGHRASKVPSIYNHDMTTPQAVFNVGGDMMSRPRDCTTTYTTAAGQPSTETDLAEHVGARACYF